MRWPFLEDPELETLKISDLTRGRVDSKPVRWRALVSGAAWTSMGAQPSTHHNRT